MIDDTHKMVDASMSEEAVAALDDVFPANHLGELACMVFHGR